MDEHAHLLAAIGRALGEDGPYVERIGEREAWISLGTMSSPPVTAAREILGGAFEGSGRVAWIEQRSDVPQNGFVPVEIDLRVAWGGQLRSVTIVDTYNPYFGCRVHLARWYGDVFVYVYREKHQMRVVRIEPPYEHQRWERLSDALVEDRDILYYLDRGTIHGRTLPELHATKPVVVTTGVREHQEMWLEAPGVVRVATWPADDERSWEERERLARAHAVAVGLPRRAAPTR